MFGSTMTPSIKTVALTGSTGSLGSKILAALFESAEFNVTVVVRKPGAPLTPGVTVKVADFSSVESLAEAFQGQDAIIDATSGPDFTVNIRIIDAAVMAGVSRIIPAEFSADPENSKARTMPVFQGKDTTFRHLKNLANEGKITYTTISNGAFVDWCLGNGFMNIDIHNKTIQLMNGGTLVVPWTALGSVAKATVQALRLESAKNRSFFIHSFQKSQKEVADLAKEALGSEGWETTTLNMDEVLASAMAQMQAGNVNMQVIGDMIRFINSTKGYCGVWERDDNAILGVSTMSNEEIKELIKKIAGSKKEE